MPVQVMLNRRPVRDHARRKAVGEGAQVPNPSSCRRDRVLILRKPQILRAETARQGGIPPSRRSRHAPKPPKPSPDELNRGGRHDLVEPGHLRREGRKEPRVRPQRRQRRGGGRHIQPRHRPAQQVLEPRRIVS